MFGKYLYQQRENKMRKNVTIKDVDSDAWTMLLQIRAEERRFTGAIIGDCIRMYWESIYFEED